MDFQASEVKEGKQAEFLVYVSFPWELVDHVGAHNEEMARHAQKVISAKGFKTPVSVRGDWYY